MAARWDFATVVEMAETMVVSTAAVMAVAMAVMKVAVKVDG